MTSEPGPSPNAERNSLFVVSLPRSLSSAVYHICSEVCGLRQPGWTTDGEVLNLDRFVFFQGPTQDFGRKFIHMQVSADMFGRATQFLDDVVSPTGYVYKDVVQPFLVADWLTRNNVKVLRIKRDVADVAYSMLRMNWYYPAGLFPNVADRGVALVQGLVCADKTLDSIGAHQVAFEQMIYDEGALRAAIRSCYPDLEVPVIRYIDDEFCQVRETIIARRSTQLHKRLQEVVTSASEALEAEAAAATAARL